MFTSFMCPPPHNTPTYSARMIPPSQARHRVHLGENCSSASMGSTHTREHLSLRLRDLDQMNKRMIIAEESIQHALRGVGGIAHSGWHGLYACFNARWASSLFLIRDHMSDVTNRVVHNP
eukprot:1242407-Amphidinium_carterae.1